MSFALDTSALVAILLDESDAEPFRLYLDTQTGPVVSVATLHELYCVVTREAFGNGTKRTNDMLLFIVPQMVPFDLDQLVIARDAYARYGRGSGHRANLNMGDCFSYALAKSRNLPLLFKGDDFIHTDIVPALKPA